MNTFTSKFTSLLASIILVMSISTFTNAQELNLPGFSGTINTTVTSGVSMRLDRDCLSVRGTKYLDGDTGGAFLATHLSTATTLHFSTNREIINPGETDKFKKNTGDIVFTGLTGGDITITNNTTPEPGTGPDNPNLHLVNEPGRFIAEFSIVSRE